MWWYGILCGVMSIWMRPSCAFSVQKLYGARQDSSAWACRPRLSRRDTYAQGAQPRCIPHCAADGPSACGKGEIDFVSKTGLRSFLVAALCHDIGHFPYAHSLKELPLARHEALAGEMIVSSSLRDYVGACGADPEQTAAIIDADRLAGESRETLLFRSFLSGVLDPDKIDYLTRDAFYCGVPYGIQDADYIMRRLVVHDDRLAIDMKGEMSIEALIFAKYQMYRAVYWHPVVRAATAMVRKAVYLGLVNDVIQATSLYGLDDTSFGRLIDHSKFPPFRIAREAEENISTGLPPSILLTRQILSMSIFWTSASG